MCYYYCLISKKTYDINFKALLPEGAVVIDVRYVLIFC